MWTRRRSRNSRKWYAKTSWALAHTRLTSSRRQRSRCHRPLRSPSTPPAASVPCPPTNNAIRLRPNPLCPLTPFLCVATRDPIAILLDIIACVFCVTPHPTNIKDLSAKIVLALSSTGYSKPLEHVQPLRCVW